MRSKFAKVTPALGLNMMSVKCANPIFFNKKNQELKFKTLANPHTPHTSDNISF